MLFITHDLSLGYYISERAVILYRGCVAEMGKTEKIYNNPLHPYTQMLMNSVPRLDKHWETHAGWDRVQPRAPRMRTLAAVITPAARWRARANATATAPG